MEKEKKTKRLTIIMLVAAVISVIGATYAVWTYTFTGSVSTINTPSIELELLESTDEIINISNALPMSDTQGMEQSNTFNFAVTTKTSGTLDVGYSLKIEKLNVDSGYTQLSDEQIRVYLTDYNNNSLLNPTFVTDLKNYVLYSKTNSHSNTVTKIQDKYKLRVWLSQNVDVSNWDANTKLQYKFKIGVMKKQEDVIATTNVYYSTSMSNVNLGDTLESIEGYTDDYTTLGANIFLKHNIFGTNNTVFSQEVCYIINGTLYCLEGGIDSNAYEKNKTVLYNTVRDTDDCREMAGVFSCNDYDWEFGSHENGYIRVFDTMELWLCSIREDGRAFCSD